MTSLRHLRSSTANKRPDPAAMVDGQLAMNYDIASPGLFFKDDNGTLIKVGPVHVGTTAPNVTPAAGGTAGNSIGEQWLDTTSGVYVLKVWDGSAWRSESGTFVDVSGDTMTGALTMANQQAVRFSETTANGSNYIALQADTALASNKTITLPDTTGFVVTTGDTGTVTSTMIANDTILNADVNASAAIAGSKISPDFGSQTVATTGIFSSAAGTAAAPSIAFTGDLNTGIYSLGADQLAVSTGGTGRLFVDASGRLLVGTSTARSNFFNATNSSLFQIEGASSNQSDLFRFCSHIFGNNDIAGPVITLGKHRSNSVGGNTVVQSGDQLGGISFQGSDGTEFVPSALILAEVDGTPGANDMPGRLTFNTTADGSSTPTERMRVTSDGYMRMAASTGGIQFNGDTAALNALDDYEEGTWTGAIATESGSNYTISAQTCQYVKVGNLVFVSFSITFTAEGSGTIAIISLPFASATGSQLILNGFVTQGNDSRSIQYTNYTLSNVLPRVDSESYINYWSTNTNWSPTSAFVGTGCYRTA